MSRLEDDKTKTVESRKHNNVDGPRFVEAILSRMQDMLKHRLLS